MTESTVRFLSALFLVFSLVNTPLSAQGFASMNGTVADETGAILPGVEVTAIQTATGIVRSVLTNDTGKYVLANLPVGLYRLEAALAGFRTHVQTGIDLVESGSLVINPVLRVRSMISVTSLHEAAYLGYPESVNELIMEGADVDARQPDGTTALMLASQNGHSEVVNSLLANGADVNLETGGGTTALLVASQAGHIPFSSMCVG